MSKKIKNLLEKNYTKRLSELGGVAVVDPKSMTGNQNNGLRRVLFQHGMKMLVVRNSLARRATSNSKLKGFEKLLDGPSALVYADKAEVTAIARLLVDHRKKEDKLGIRGVFFEGEVYEGIPGLERVSKFPTRDEAIANVLASILSPGRKLGGIFKGQASRVASLIKAVEEMKEKAGGAEASSEAPAPDAAPAA